jgi:hypothetical protein
MEEVPRPHHVLPALARLHRNLTCWASQLGVTYGPNQMGSRAPSLVSCSFNFGHCWCSTEAWLLSAHKRPKQVQQVTCRANYSITSSARASSVGGTVRPSAFAVLRLMISSNFVA